jgi:cobalt-zinc-cadmium efflux system outer membrane protein
MFKRILLFVAVAVALSGCTAHPRGEREERKAALDAGSTLAHREALPANPTPDELVRYALLSNADLEQKYWQWRSAIEQVPQDGTQPTNLVLFSGVPITNGSTAFDRTTVTVANDPMADILWPDKPATAARRALDNARAAGVRFLKARYELRAKVLGAYYDYALTAELIRLEQQNAQLLQTTASATEARNRAGAAGQQDVLKAANEIDLSRNDIANMQSQLPSQRAALNALLNRPPDAPIPTPRDLPPITPMSQTDSALLVLAAQRNPELAALAHEIQGNKEAIRLAKLQYYPDFSLSVSTDLGGIAQNLMGMVTVPLLRYQAINAAIAQAEANLRATEAMRIQTRNDLSAQVVLDLTTLRDADRQLDLFQHTILSRARRAVEVARSSYESSRGTLLDLLDNQRALIAIERLVVNLRITREKRLADIEAITAAEIREPAVFTAPPRD